MLLRPAMCMPRGPPSGVGGGRPGSGWTLRHFPLHTAAGTPTPPPPTPAPALSRAEDPRQAGSLFRQLVDDEKDWATPSLFKLGWLSSMTK